MDRELNGKLDRRGFLKGAAAAGMTLAAAGVLTACSPQTEDGGTQTPPASSDAGSASVSAGSGVNGYICGEDWLGEAPKIADADITETYDFDVVVLGSGHAGTQAALAAAQGGANVAVIESQPEDAYTCFGDDICSYNSDFMIKRGFGPYNTAEITAEYIRRTCGRAKPTILKSFVENSGEMMDNLVSLVPSTSNALDFDSGQCIVQIAYDKPKGSDYPLFKSGFKAWASTLQTINSRNPTPVNGREDISRLTELETYCILEAERLGGQWFWGHTAAALVQDGNGDVIGAIAQNANGDYVKFNAAKGVLLSTGDFSSNPDMVYNLFDDGNEWGIRVGQQRDGMGAFGRDGIGHKLGCWAGGGIEPHPRPAMSTAKGVPGPWGTLPALILNGEGERFMNEAMAQYTGATFLRQPLLFNAVVMDSKYMEVIKSAGLDHGAPNWGSPSQLAKMDEDMKNIPLDDPEGGQVTQVEIISATPSEHDTRTAFASATLEGLLKILGYEGEALKTALESVEHYNQIVKSGKDTDFDKDTECLFTIDTPPFYGVSEAVEGTVKATLVTLAGLLTDNNLNVMKLDRSAPIKGLYAAGNCLGQRYGVGYATPSAGNSIGMAMTHGRVAGKILAAL
jgi:succinate dehydrogenase/fumarate reductase flavoprotein subunit